MKNFTNNFKQFTSRLSARWLIMALMLLLGTSSAWGWTIYYDNSGTPSWTDVYVVIGHDTWWRSYQMTKNNNVFQYTDTGWDDATFIAFSNSHKNSNGGNNTDWNSISNIRFGYGVSHVDKHVFTTNSSKLVDITHVNDVLNGNVIGFYVGEYTSWNQQQFYVKNSSVTIPTCLSFESESSRYGVVYASSFDYTISHGDGTWGGPTLGEKAVLGTAYLVTSNNSVSKNAGTLPSCTFSIDNTIKAGETSTKSVTSSGKSKYGTQDYAEDSYYVKKSGETTLTKLEVEGNELQTQSLAVGEYTIYVLLFDGRIYAKGGEQTLTVETACEKPSAPSITINGVTGPVSVSICSGESAIIEAGQIDDAILYSLYKGNNDAPAQTNNTGIFEVSEAVSYRVTVTTTCGESRKSSFVTLSKKTGPTASNYVIKDASKSKEYTGSEQTLTAEDITVNNAGPVASVYFKQNGNTVNPINVGDYEVYVTTAATDDICAGDIKIGTFTITQATQTGFVINNTTLNICGTSVVVTSTGGQGGDVTYIIETDNTTTKDATINSTTGELKVNSAGTVIVTATKAETTNYEEATNSKEFTFIMLPNVALTETSISVCSNEEINLSEYVNEYSGTIKWYSDSEYNTEITELTFIPKNQIYYVKATNGECTPATAELDIKVTQVPAQPELDTVDPQCDSYTLPTEDKDGLPIRWYNSNGSVLASNTIIQSGTYYAEGVNEFCVSDSRTEVEVTINKTPTITGKSVTQPDTEITLTSIQGVTWSVSPTENVTLTNNGDGTATFSASVIGDFVVYAEMGNCSTEYPITVTDKGNIIYVRRPKSEDGNNYTYWYNSEFMGEEYYGTQNYIKNGADFSTAYENNQKGTAPTLPAAFTDCDGYVWDKFEVLGYESFFVHAPVQTGFGGFSTFTQKIDVALGQPEMYVTIGTWSSGLGAPITKVEAPSLVKVHASGSTTLGANKFAALYVTDCSGREIDAYQWEYCSTESGNYENYKASVTNNGTLYSGDAGKSNNIRPSVAGFYRCTVTYKGGGTATSAAEEVTGTYSYLESNIPVIVVNTNGVGFPYCPSTGGTASKNADVLKEKRSVDVKIYDGTTLVYDRKARMNYRGSSSLNFQKKSYAFCPGKDNCVEDKGRQDYVKTEKMNMLGVGSAVDKDWVLYASAADPTLMRNRLVFDTYKAMRPDDWSVQSRYVELIVDGEHKGVYVLMDKITKNDNRVKLNEENGFIVKFDKTDCADRFGGYNNIWGDEKTFKTTYTGYDYVSTYDTHIDQRFEIEYPEKDDYTIGWSSKVKSIQAMFQAFEDALKAGEYATVQKYIDYDSWADWFIINEYTKNVDAYRASCIFVYTGEEGAKIEARPLWDQELSFNNQCPNYMTGYGSNDATGFLIQESKVYEKTDKHIAAPFWFTGGGTDITGGLLSDPCFVQIVKEKWSKYSTASGPLTEGVLKAKIGEYTTELGAAKNREAEYWKTHSRSTLSCPWDNNTTGYNNTTTVTASLSSMETWFASRGTGLTNAINGLTGSSFSIEIMPYTQNVTPWTSANVAIIVKPEGYDYKLEYIGENDLSSVANAIIEQEGDNITYRIPRPSEWGTGDAVEGERANVEYIIKATLNVQERTSVCGSQAAPTSTAIIKLIDEENDNCPKP